MNYKNRHSGEIISQEGYKCLPAHRTRDWEETEELVTHELIDDGDIYTIPLTGAEESVTAEKFAGSFMQLPKIQI